jgi:hypothetical protein
VVTTAAGGADDFVARTVAQRLSATMGRPVIIENEPAENGSVAAGEVARLLNVGLFPNRRHDRSAVLTVERSINGDSIRPHQLPLFGHKRHRWYSAKIVVPDPPRSQSGRFSLIHTTYLEDLYIGIVLRPMIC